MLEKGTYIAKGFCPSHFATSLSIVHEEKMLQSHQPHKRGSTFGAKFANLYLTSPSDCIGVQWVPQATVTLHAKLMVRESRFFFGSVCIENVN